MQTTKVSGRIFVSGVFHIQSIQNHYGPRPADPNKFAATIRIESDKIDPPPAAQIAIAQVEFREVTPITKPSIHDDGYLVVPQPLEAIPLWNSLLTLPKGLYYIDYEIDGPKGRHAFLSPTPGAWQQIGAYIISPPDVAASRSFSGLVEKTNSIEPTELSVNVQTHGRPILLKLLPGDQSKASQIRVACGAQGNRAICEVIRDGQPQVTVSTNQLRLDGANAVGIPSSSISGIDLNPGVQTRTYRVRLSSNSSVEDAKAYFDNVRLVAIEV